MHSACWQRLGRCEREGCEGRALRTPSSRLELPAELQAGGVCGLCEQALEGAVAPCSCCGVFVHASCWARLAQCPTIGCPGFGAPPLSGGGLASWRRRWRPSEVFAAVSGLCASLALLSVGLGLLCEALSDAPPALHHITLVAAAGALLGFLLTLLAASLEPFEV